MPQPTPSDFAALVDLQQRQEAQIRVIASGHAQLVNQISEITVTLRHQDERIAVSATQLKRIESAVSENTDLTRDIRDAILPAAKPEGIVIQSPAAEAAITTSRTSDHATGRHSLPRSASTATARQVLLSTRAAYASRGCAGAASRLRALGERHGRQRPQRGHLQAGGLVAGLDAAVPGVAIAHRIAQ